MIKAEAKPALERRAGKEKRKEKRVEEAIVISSEDEDIAVLEEKVWKKPKLEKTGNEKVQGVMSGPSVVKREKKPAQVIELSD